MTTFLMLSTLGPEGMATLRQNPQRLKEVNTEVEAMGARVVAQWALLGQYDFATVLEAPDEKVVTRVAVALGARGTLKTKTLTAVPIDEFIEAASHARYAGFALINDRAATLDLHPDGDRCGGRHGRRQRDGWSQGATCVVHLRLR